MRLRMCDGVCGSLLLQAASRERLEAASQGRSVPNAALRTAAAARSSSMQADDDLT